MVKNVMTYSAVLFSFALLSHSAFAVKPESIAAAIRMSGTITGGSMPTNSTVFTNMVNAIDADHYLEAANIAAESSYGANYILRRLALQNQNISLDASVVKDNDATAFLIAHFAGAPGVTPSISKIWSDNLTCSVKVGAATIRAVDLTAADKVNIDWRTALTCTPGQTIIDSIATDAATQAAANNTLTIVRTTLPAKHVGGYMTLSNKIDDTSFADVMATAGTNLRLVQGMWVIATGMQTIDFASTENARAQNVPRFVPENDPSFFVGQGQTACIACHGGGLTAVNHGFNTFADVFDFDRDRGGFKYFTNQNNNGDRKSLGSDGNKRTDTFNCNLTPFKDCNQDGPKAADVNQTWDLAATWGARGMLNTLGWQGSTSGQGLNSLGTALGQANIVYTNLVKRVQAEVCPLGVLSDSDIGAIASAGKASDDVRDIVALVASNVACR